MRQKKIEKHIESMTTEIHRIGRVVDRMASNPSSRKDSVGAEEDGTCKYYTICIVVCIAIIYVAIGIGLNSAYNKIEIGTKGAQELSRSLQQDVNDLEEEIQRANRIGGPSQEQIDQLRSKRDELGRASAGFDYGDRLLDGSRLLIHVWFGTAALLVVRILRLSLFLGNFSVRSLKNASSVKFFMPEIFMILSVVLTVSMLCSLEGGSFFASVNNGIFVEIIILVPLFSTLSSFGDEIPFALKKNT